MWSKRLNQLTIAQREIIWQRAQEGVSPTLLSKRFGVSVMTIYRIMGERKQKETGKLVAK